MTGFNWSQICYTAHIEDTEIQSFPSNVKECVNVSS